jgi:SAM-dependent methyltransferase
VHDGTIVAHGPEHAEFADAPIRNGTHTEVRFFEWGEDDSSCDGFSTLLDDERFDFIVASDVVCRTEDAVGVAKAITRLLAPGGRALLVLPATVHRFGVEAFGPALGECGAPFTVCDVVDPDLLEGLSENAYMTWRLYQVGPLDLRL